MSKPGEKVTILVKILKPINPFYEMAREMRQEMDEEDKAGLAPLIVVAQRLAAVKTDEAWEEVADKIRTFNNVQIESEATDFVLNKEDESESLVEYTVALKFVENYMADQKLSADKTLVSTMLEAQLTLNRFTHKRGDKW
jgi:hypothetical protein